MGIPAMNDRRQVRVGTRASALARTQTRIVADRLTDIGRASEPTAHEHLEAGLARLVQMHAQPDVVHGDRGTVVRRARHGDLELARQIREFGVQERVLPEQLAIHARIDELVLGASRVLIRRDVAHAVSG